MKKSEANVKPIKSVQDLCTWENYLKANGPEKIRAFFRLGLDTGMHPSFLQRLKWSDLKIEEQGSHLKRTDIYFEVATNVEWDRPCKKIYLCDRSIEVLDQLREHYPDDIYLFQSRSPHARKNPSPLTIQRITLELKRTAVASGIIGEDEPFGAVALRKSNGYHQIMYGGWTVHQMMRYLAQRSMKITREYLDLPENVPLGCTPRKRSPWKRKKD